MQNMFMRSIGTVAIATVWLMVHGGCHSESNMQQEASGSTRRAAREPTIADAKRYLRMGNHEAAADLVYRLLISNKDEIELKVLAAQIEAARGNPQGAIDLAAEIDLNHSRFGVLVAKLLVDQASKIGDESTAEATLRSMIGREPGTASWRHLLWRLLDSQGRRQEASEQADALCRLGQATTPELISLIRRNEVFPRPEEDAVPDDRRVRSSLAKAKWHLARQQFAEAENELLAQAENDFQHLATAALYLRVLAEQQKTKEFLRTHARYGKEIRAYADYWCAVGSLFIDQSEYNVATGLLLRAVEIDPTMRIAFQRLSRCLRALGRKEDAAQFRYRGVQLAETETVGRRIVEDDQNSLARRDLAKMLLELGRPFEALEWTRSVIPPFSTGQLAMVASRRREIAALPESNTIAATTALLQMSPSDFPHEQALDRLIKDASPQQPETVNADVRPPTVTPRLVNVAAQVRADFQWYHDIEINFDSIPLYESVGGGIAVLDFDLDGWPDLYFSQGSGRPPQFDCTRSSELRRNIRGVFSEVTLQSEALDFHYSSGVAAGDVNQDGFPDLYLGSLAKNRLLINNGDGTFRDASGSLGTDEDFFTSSVAIGDIDGDSLPDLFEVNYIESAGGFTQPKKDKYGNHELPSPALFYAQADRFFRSDGDGQFSKIDIRHDVADPGTGLGIIISNFDDQGGNEVFVGNDMRENHLLRYHDGQFVNLADIQGIACGSHGLANGCMGIATGDFDRNGTFDLHIGNYRSESDNFFLQNSNGTYRDVAALYGIRDISLPYVVFGSKTLDFDRNGWLDLAVTNGHIFDMRRVNQGYKMPPHLMMSSGEGFELVDVEDPSGYWDGEYLGRTMVVIDFNRNGASDLVIGHLDVPTALLDNQTETNGNHVMLELAGTTSERDAVGSKIIVRAGGDAITQWVTAGDGYFCSDETYLDIAIAENDSIESVEVVWPSGARSVYRDIQPNHRYLLIENERGSFLRQ